MKEHDKKRNKNHHFDIRMYTVASKYGKFDLKLTYKVLQKLFVGINGYKKKNTIRNL